MAGSAMAAWLDSFFAGYDHFFLNILHVLADKLGVVLTPLMRVISFLGEKGILFFLLALIFMLMADRRDLGVCIFGAVCCGALITNILLKDAVGRLRPFEAVAEYQEWWRAAGAVAEDDWSFPSGHVTACAAGMTAICLMRGKRWILPSVLVIFIMGVSRNYLMAHYPSDVLFAAIIGVFSGFVAWIITQAIFRFLKRRRSNPIFATILDFDIRDVQQFSLPKLVVPVRGAKKAAPAPRRRVAAKDAPVEEPDLFDDDVKTYSGSTRRSRTAAEEEPVPRRSRTVAAEEEPAPRRSRAAAAEEEPVPRRSRTVAAEEKPAPRRSRIAAAEEKPAPRRSRTAAAKEAPVSRRSRTAAASGGRHTLESAAQSGSSRASRSNTGRLSSGGYQGKHVK